MRSQKIISQQGLLTIVLTTFLYSVCFSQQPIITGIDKTSAGTDDVVTITGNNFGSIQNDLVVFFGAAKGDITFTSNQLLEVKVPTGATFDKVSVTHLPSKLTGYSNKNFFPSFGGANGFTASNLEGQKDFQTIPDTDMKGLYDLCTCDFNSDGNNDIATANQNSNSMSLLKNITPAQGIANLNFEVSSILVNTKTLHITCGDLNGDGKPDLVATEGGDTGDRVIILKNTTSGSTISFLLPPTLIKLTGKKVKRIKIADLNADGKPELIISSQNNNNITVLKNESTGTGLSFSSTPIFIPITGAASTDALAINDLDGDGFLDLVVSQFVAPTSNIFVLKNTGGSGSINFSTPIVLPLPEVIADIHLADLNNDQKPDIISTIFIDNRIDILLNTTPSGGSITYSSPTSIVSDGNPFGLALGDLDGDGKLDMAVSSVTKKELKILHNTSTSTLTFQSIIKPTTFINRHTTISDFDGDGKPDVSFTSIDDLVNSVLASKVSIFRNTSCAQPIILPEGPVTICESFPLELTSTVIPGATYTWRNGATIVSTGTDPSYDVSTTPGVYNYTVTVSDCPSPIQATPVQVTVQSGTLPLTPLASSNGPVCEGSMMQLTVNTGDTFEWTGPGTLAGPTDKEPVITNFQAEDAGRYTVDIYLNGCLAARESTVVEVIAVPDFTISTGGSSVVCNGDTKTLTLSPALSTFTYQWYNDAGPIVGQTSTMYTATVSGNYYVEAESAQCSAAIQTDPVVITFAPPIIADFTFLDDRCVGQDVEFTNLSTFDNSLPVTYAWTFGDAGTADVKNAIHRYQTASTFTITLQMSYENGACLNNNSKVLVVHAAPVVNITAPNNDFSICEGESIELGVSGIFNSYNWNTGESTPTITVSEERNYIVNITNSFGCEVTASKNITVTPAPEVIVTATPASVLEGESSQLQASGLDNYSWNPDPTLSDLNISNPIATPLQTTLYKVQGLDGNGCAGEAFIEVILKSGSPSSKLTASNFFSPSNGDEINKYWTVERIEEFPECGIFIYDDKGIQVFNAKPYLNDWDGTFNGKQLPDGVYYFIIKCEGDSNPPKAGSITILR